MLGRAASAAGKRAVCGVRRTFSAVPARLFSQSNGSGGGGSYSGSGRFGATAAKVAVAGGFVATGVALKHRYDDVQQQISRQLEDYCGKDVADMIDSKGEFNLLALPDDGVSYLIEKGLCEDAARRIVSGYREVADCLNLNKAPINGQRVINLVETPAPERHDGRLKFAFGGGVNMQVAALCLYTLCKELDIPADISFDTNGRAMSDTSGLSKHDRSDFKTMHDNETYNAVSMLLNSLKARLYTPDPMNSDIKLCDISFSGFVEKDSLEKTIVALEYLKIQLKDGGGELSDRLLRLGAFSDGMTDVLSSKIGVPLFGKGGRLHLHPNGDGMD